MTGGGKMAAEMDFSRAQDLLKSRILSQFGSVKVFAEASGIPRTSIYNWLGDMSRMPAYAIVQVFSKLGLEPNELLQADWERKAQVEFLSDEELDVIRRYRSDDLFRAMINKIK